MLPPVTISVSNFFESSVLHTREQAERLFTSILSMMHDHEPIWVDFSNIEFISRSFADELVHLKAASKKRRLINFCCASPDVSNMLQAVEHTQTKNAKEKKLPIQRFESLESLINFFSKV